MSGEHGADFVKLLNRHVLKVEAYLEALYLDWDVPGLLAEASRYSLLAGGKRFRPVICMASALACAESADKGMDPDEMEAKIMPFAAALELVHTYSLVHDDLPAMDNDDLRRGKPTSHVVYGEGKAILVGDALLTDAFALSASCALPARRLVRAIGLLAEEAGSRGMVGGQCLDLQAEGRSLGLDELADLNSRKTGSLFRAACQCGAVLAGASPEQEQALNLYGQSLGLAFQITDDILDLIGDEGLVGKRLGKDAEHAKATWPGLIGLERSKQLADSQADQAVRALSAAGLHGRHTGFLAELAKGLASRVA